jgi:hypothetical protein
MQGLIPLACQPFAKPTFDVFSKPAATTSPLDVTEVVHRAVDEQTWQLHFAAGADAVALAQAGCAVGAAGCSSQRFTKANVRCNFTGRMNGP